MTNMSELLEALGTLDGLLTEALIQPVAQLRDLLSSPIDGPLPLRVEGDREDPRHALVVMLRQVHNRVHGMEARSDRYASAPVNSNTLPPGMSGTLVQEGSWGYGVDKDGNPVRSSNPSDDQSE